MRPGDEHDGAKSTAQRARFFPRLTPTLMAIEPIKFALAASGRLLRVRRRLAARLRSRDHGNRLVKIWGRSSFNWHCVTDVLPSGTAEANLRYRRRLRPTRPTETTVMGLARAPAM